MDEFTIVNCKTTREYSGMCRPALTTNVTRTSFIHFYLGSKTTASREVENAEFYLGEKFPNAACPSIKIFQYKKNCLRPNQLIEGGIELAIVLSRKQLRGKT